MKFKKFIILIIIILCLIGVFIMLLPMIKNQSLKNEELISISTSTSGGMLGGLDSAELKLEKDGSVKYITRHAHTHADRIVTKTYEASKEDLEEMKELIIKNNLYKISKNGQSPYFAYDADTTSIRAYFSSGESIYAHSDLKMSKNEAENFYEIVSHFSKFAKGEPIIEIENHEIALYIDGYQIGYIMENSNLTETLLTHEGKFIFNDYLNIGKAAQLEFDLDIKDLSKSNNIHKGDLLIDIDTKELIFIYEDKELDKELYKIGYIEWSSDSSYDLIKTMQDNNEYYISVRK